ncbi:hypothetical protein COT48_01480 [Candidatus Woesearchaeota archaeon CG08_land_8_20_14_0_20_47_9]|nr:MAG: hypothetical protein COV22_00755 [Candidatus Woesearchaeota archaeon CG10_big_fil_rev_8_21_14_0_10_47_5]PIO04232.1 MAG: hypothetical protein COT48_01480 [Candidatus Woesearchaeota archaeon CG08_land_8_20_14_0_20_47_9]HII30170.1 hypothetical protein [Candidatus Woesearchaeota archaeon]
MDKALARALYWLPRVMGIFFAVFISLFALDAFRGGFSLPGFAIQLIPALIVVAALITAWKSELIGGAILVILGCLYIMVAWARFPLTAYLVISAPLFVIGGLFIVGYFYVENTV